MRKLWCYGKAEFDRTMASLGWHTEKDIKEAGACIISICSEGETHWFKENSGTVVLNLDFEDVETDVIDCKTGKTLYRTISDSQVDRAVDFLLDNLGKDIYVHCSAGVSRSQAFVRVILDMFPSWYTSECCRPENPCEMPNYGVVCKLKRKLYERKDINIG